MADPSLLCVNCGAAPPAHRRTWDRCKLCARRNLPATYYCGEACMEAHWPKHRQYHKEQKEREEDRLGGTLAEQDRSEAEKEARRAERTGDEFDHRVAAAMTLSAEGNHHAAAKACARSSRSGLTSPRLKITRPRRTTTLLWCCSEQTASRRQPRCSSSPWSS